MMMPWSKCPESLSFTYEHEAVDFQYELDQKQELRSKVIGLVVLDI